MYSAKTILPPPDVGDAYSLDTSILAALALKLPLKSTKNPSSLVQEWFSKKQPNTELKDIQDLTVPSDSTLQQLAIQLCIAMEDGYCALIYLIRAFKTDRIFIGNTSLIHLAI